MENIVYEPQAAEAEAAPLPTVLASPFTRHDGWTGERMAIFCEALAETAIVAEACQAANMGISGAYACRRRNPVFAAAWDAALTIARERLADTLLARSMEGNIEQIWRDGEIVGERHLLDNRLGLAILRRLDRLAETGTTVSSRGERYMFSGEGRSPGQRATAASRRLAPGLRREAFDWELAIDALRTGDEAAVCQALALFQGDKVEEVEGPPDSFSQGDKEPEGIDLTHRCWTDDDMGEKVWMTDFPPPADFTGYQSCDYGDPDREYQRECTPEEVEILEADAAAARATARAEEEVLRDEWFALLKSELPSTAKAEQSERRYVESQRASDGLREATGPTSRSERKAIRQNCESERT